MHYYEFIVLRFLATSGTWAIYKRRGPGLLHVLWQCLPLIHSCNKEGTWPSSCLVQKVRASLRLLLLMHVHVLKRKKIPYRIWTLMRTNKFSLSRRGCRGDWHWLRQPGGRRALQPLRGGLRREAQRPRRTDDRPCDHDAGCRRGGGPRRHLLAWGRIRVHRRLNSEPW